MAKKDGIYKRGNTYWITFNDASGGRRWESSKSKYYAAAEKMLAVRRVEAAKGKLPELLAKKQQITFRELSVRYLEHCQHQRDIKNKEHRIKKFLLPYFGDRMISSISMSDIEKFYSDQINSCASISTANRRLEILKHMWTKAVDWNLLPEEDLKKVRKVKKKSERESWRTRYLERHEAVLLLESCNEDIRPDRKSVV